MESLAVRVAHRYVQAYFKPGQYILYGKFKNKRGKILRIFTDDRGVPRIEIQPVPKGRKKNRIMGLYTIRQMAPELVPETQALERSVV